MSWHRCATHSWIGLPAVAFISAFLPYLIVAGFGLTFWGSVMIPLGRMTDQLPGEDLRAYAIRHRKVVFSVILLASFCSTLLHMALDVCQSDGVAMLWPFSSRRFALDLLPYLEPWLLTILLLAILLPELFRLVGEEIGSRSKAPRGRNGAIAGLICALLYIGARALLHGNALASLNAHTIAGEMPRRAAAFPDSTSPFLWHSVVETQSTMNLVILRSSGGEVSYASAITTLHKPEPSPILNAAQNSPAALAFIQVARFPKATVETEADGYSVEIQDLKDQASGEESRAIFADINLYKNGKVVLSELQWQKSVSDSKER